MIILDYQKKHHAKIVRACSNALRQGKVIAYPTDTSYGLAVDAANIKAIKKLYRLKGRSFNKPVHVIPPSISYVKKILNWNKTVSRLAQKFWPGPLTLVLGLRAKGLGYRMLSAETGWLGVRMPKNRIALDLAKILKRPITTTSANVSGRPDCYSAQDVIKQFSAKGGSAYGGKKQKFKPDIIINFGKLPKRRPSTVVKILDDQIEILRFGPITPKQIFNAA